MNIRFSPEEFQRLQDGMNQQARKRLDAVETARTKRRHLGYGYMPAEGHHIRDGQGVAMRADDMLTVGLCTEHHRGGSGLHGMGRKAFERTYRLSELDLLAMTLEAIEP